MLYHERGGTRKFSRLDALRRRRATNSRQRRSHSNPAPQRTRFDRPFLTGLDAGLVAVEPDNSAAVVHRHYRELVKPADV